MSPKMSGTALVALGCVVACLTSCGVGPHHILNAASLSHEISSELSARYPVGSPIVNCPPDVAATTGTEFVCSTVLDGQPVQLDGTVTGSNGRFTFIPQAAIIVIATATSLLTHDLADQTHVRPLVTCGTRLVAVVAVGKSFTCSATFPGQSPRKVTVTVTDRQGHVRVTLAP
jgi:uncharacterized protein DUF4333